MSSKKAGAATFRYLKTGDAVLPCTQCPGWANHLAAKAALESAKELVSTHCVDTYLQGKPVSRKVLASIAVRCARAENLCCAGCCCRRRDNRTLRVKDAGGEIRNLPGGGNRTAGLNMLFLLLWRRMGKMAHRRRRRGCIGNTCQRHFRSMKAAIF